MPLVTSRRRRPRPAWTALLSALALVAASPARAEGDGMLAPRLKRRIAIEDEPIRLEVMLPDGMPLTAAPGGINVGDAGVLYDFAWQLRDASGELLRERRVTSRRPQDRWETAAIVEPYSARYPDKLQVVVEVTYRRENGQRLQSASSTFSIPRIQDVTPPLTKSMGDEESYRDFVAQSLTVEDGAVVTTTDRLAQASGEPMARSPFQAILDDGATLEGDPSEPESLGVLEFEWANVFDNLAPPFTGNRPGTLGRFGLYLIPRWDLGGSHHLVEGESSPHLKASRELVREHHQGVELYLVDLTDRLGEPPPEGGSYGEGRVRIPLPYDRVGDLEVGFFAEDRAWPSPNHIRKGRFRFRVEDDIAPTILFTMRKERRGEERWLTADSVNRRWTSQTHAFGLPEKFSGPPMNELAALDMRRQRPYRIRAMCFDNTRLDRSGLKVRLEAPEGAAGFGLRVAGRRGRKLELEAPTDGFDPSLARTAREPEVEILLGSPGRYRVVLEASDIHGNHTRFEVPLQVGERDHDWIHMGEQSVRGGGE